MRSMNLKSSPFGSPTLANPVDPIIQRVGGRAKMTNGQALVRRPHRPPLFSVRGRLQRDLAAGPIPQILDRRPRKRLVVRVDKRIAREYVFQRDARFAGVGCVAVQREILPDDAAFPVALRAIGPLVTTSESET